MKKMIVFCIFSECSYVLYLNPVWNRKLSISLFGYGSLEGRVRPTSLLLVVRSFLKHFPSEVLWIKDCIPDDKSVSLKHVELTRFKVTDFGSFVLR